MGLFPRSEPPALPPVGDLVASSGVDRGVGDRAAAGSPSMGGVQVRRGPDELVEATREALRGVYDPELGIDVVSLGLIYDVRHEDGNVVVDMTLTTPGCPVSDSMPEVARAAIADAVEAAKDVVVQVVWDPPWSPAMMSEDAGAALGLPRH